jgi:hypothetical protein
MINLRPRLKQTIPKKNRRLNRCLPTFTVVVALSLVFVFSPVHAQIFDQYQVKAVFLYNLTNFITWPRSPKGHDKDQPFTIAIIGQDNLSAYLDKTVAEEYINGRKVVLKQFKALAELQQQPCDLLFIGEDQLSIWPQIRIIAREHAILTVSDVEGFALRGGMVNLLTSGRKIQIEINVEEAKRNGFDISAKLLKLARIVYGGKDK